MGNLRDEWRLQRLTLAVEKESTGPVIAPEQLRGAGGKSYGKTHLKTVDSWNCKERWWNRAMFSGEWWIYTLWSHISGSRLQAQKLCLLSHEAASINTSILAAPNTLPSCTTTLVLINSRVTQIKNGSFPERDLLKRSLWSMLPMKDTVLGHVEVRSSCGGLQSNYNCVTEGRVDVTVLCCSLKPCWCP